MRIVRRCVGSHSGVTIVRVQTSLGPEEVVIAQNRFLTSVLRRLWRGKVVWYQPQPQRFVKDPADLPIF